MGQSIKKSGSPTTVYDHIRELQMRFLASILSLAAAGTIVYLFYGSILAFLSSPLGAPLYYSTPAGSFTFVMKICLTGAMIITTPVITYNLIMFVRPAFDKILSKKQVFVTTAYSTALAISGAMFAFYCILPGTLAFFKGFQVTGLNALISADDYLGFVTNIITMFVIVFQIPLIISFIDKIKPLKPKKLLKLEKWVILGSLVIALLAPFTYDLITSLLIALPIVVLYNLSIAMVVISHAKASRKAQNVIQAVIAKPIMASNESLMPEVTIESLEDELVNLEKAKPISNLNTFGECMDIKPLHARQETVEPAPWVEERKARRAAINAHVHVFSDINRSMSNRALA